MPLSRPARLSWTALLASFGAAALALAGCAAGDPTRGSPAGDAPEVKGQTLCGAASAWGGKCADARTACDDKIVGSCNALSSVINPTLLEGARECVASAACDSAPVSCLATSIAKAAPRDAHKKLAKAYCSRCTLMPGDGCDALFLSREGASKALASLALPLSDALAKEVEDKCTSTPGCQATFLVCAQGVVAKTLAEQLDADGASCVMKGLFEEAASKGGDGADSTTPKPPDPSCKPATCADLGKSCGQHDDGCGGKIDCGACPTNCVPKTCQQLGKTCGTWDDGCGGTASCGACPTQCAPDAKEPNNDRTKAASLGTLTDSPESSRSLYSLTLSDGDEDWFTAKVTDAGWWGNPRIQVSTARPVEVTVFYVCDGGTDYSYCPSGETTDNAVGHGCRSTATSTIQTSCNGIDESGTMYVRVRKTKSDGLCGGYSLDVRVNEG